MSPRDKSGKPLTKNHSSKFSFGMNPSSRTARELTLNQQNSSLSKKISAGSSSQKNSLMGKHQSLLSNEIKPSKFKRENEEILKDSSEK